MKIFHGKSGGVALSLLSVAFGQAVYAAEDATMLGDVVVSSTREAEKKSEVPATVDDVGEDVGSERQ